MASGTSENIQEIMNELGINPEKYELVDIQEAASRLGITERQVFNRASDGSIRRIKNGRNSLYAIPKKVKPSAEINHEVREASFVNVPDIQEVNMKSQEGAYPDNIFSLVEKTLDKLDQYHTEVIQYHSQIVELSKENTQYKLLSDNHSNSLKEYEAENESLKQQLFEKDARIKELKAKSEQVVSKNKSWWKFW